MFYVKKTIEIAGAHFLSLPYESACGRVHGHNWRLSIYCKGEVNDVGMVIDFTEIKKIVMELDHQLLNDFISQPTAENIAKFICDQIPYCYRVDVIESENNEATYEVDE